MSLYLAAMARYIWTLASSCPEIRWLDAFFSRTRAAFGPNANSDFREKTMTYLSQQFLKTAAGNYCRLDNKQIPIRYLKKFAATVTACLFLCYIPTACIADENLLPFPTEFNLGDETRLKLEMNERIRGEFADWFGNQQANGKVTPKEYSYNFVGNKFQLGARLTNSFSESFAQLQDTLVAALPTNGLGVGAAYYQNRPPETTQNSVFLRQGWSKLKYNGFFLSGGRQLYSDGAQGTARNTSLKWIQDTRIAQRLIGPFDYTHTGRSFDGGALGYSSDSIEVSGFGFVPTWGGFETDGMPEISGVDVAGASLNLRDTGFLPNVLARLSYYYYGDNRNIAAVDNSIAATQANGLPINIHTLGGSIAHVIRIGPGNLDGMLYAFGQVGKWRALNQAAWAYGAEFGYQFMDVWASPWLRVGVNSGSGDSNPHDNTHGTFFQMLPTAWLYAQFPFYNMMNNQDVFVQAVLKPHPMITTRIDFHSLSVNASSDLVYSGSGATNNTLFGYSGMKTGGYLDLAYLAHASVNFKPLDFLQFNAFYAHAFGQSILSANYAGNQGNYAFLEAVVSF
ncbi:alginate export family protein [Candidatus Methylospira mobilis]|uniref:alginate export family protein n=1 Tax=Candidatus Methylospira mobilis TaxID=1808979 RepID=UPI0028E64E83|nr:alginate export family protein [Candidatus Methylospira mobilis]WNV04957.1 alginate export family protein [Candidatus Methylospira mobilis]